MKAAKLVLVAGMVCAISACSGPVVMMKDQQSGALATCKGGSVATGMTSERVASDLMTECVDGYLQRGYTVIAASQ